MSRDGLGVLDGLPATLNDDSTVIFASLELPSGNPLHLIPHAVLAQNELFTTVPFYKVALTKVSELDAPVCVVGECAQLT